MIKFITCMADRGSEACLPGQCSANGVEVGLMAEPFTMVKVQGRQQGAGNEGEGCVQLW